MFVMLSMILMESLIMFDNKYYKQITGDGHGLSAYLNVGKSNTMSP